MSTGADVVPFFKKKGKGRPAAARQRSASPPPSALAAPAPSTSQSTVVLPARKAAGNLLSAGTKRTRTQRDGGGGGGGGDADADGAERDGPDVKWTAAGSHQHAALDILAGDEAEELLAKRLKKDPRNDEDEDLGPDDGLYKGQSAYKSHIKKNKEIPKSMRVGPQKGSSTIRTVTIVDYQPDVCKDYKETGFCGFGDTCKFLHDRGTYLQGWQLDKLAENPARDAGDESDSDDSDEDIPFACLICRKHYTDPIVTRCGHYFCSACAIKRFAKTPKCLACGAPTAGIFNRADKVIEKVNKKRQEKEDRKREDSDADEGVQIEGLAADANQSGRSGDSDQESDSDDED